MKRLFTDLQSTIPFVNTDFSEILQNQHMIAYSAYLEGLNDQPYSVNATNRGIILNGITIDAVPNLGQSVDVFNWTLNIDKDALVYFDGQYYSPDPNTINITTPNQYSNCKRLFIYPLGVTQSEGGNRVDDRQRQFRSGATQSFSVDYIFRVFKDTSTSVSIPSPLTYPGGTQGVPYILLEFGGTSRNLSRLMKLNSTNKGDVLITYNPKNWNVIGSSWNTGGSFPYGYYRDFKTSFAQGNFNNFSSGRNELLGFQVFDSTLSAGRFMVGYDRTRPVSPSKGVEFDFNYGTPSNVGGTISVVLYPENFAAHDHSGITDVPDRNMDHAHRSPVDVQYFKEPPVREQETDLVHWTNHPTFTYGKIPADANEFTDPPFKLRGLPVFQQILNWGPNLNQNAWGNNPPYWDSYTYSASEHKHKISPNDGGASPHENRPPYVVTLFYTKS